MTPNWEVEKVDADSRLARVFSPSNIALSKYWGKRDLTLNLPTNGSISVTLKDFGSFTTVEFHENFSKDRLILNGKEESHSELALIPPKVKSILDAVRERVPGKKQYARIQSWNNFPTGAGLASSASGMSAIAYGAAKALNLNLPPVKISEIARVGSGSACRSIFAGFVEWTRGEFADGSDSIAYQLSPTEHWPLKAFIAVVKDEKKEHLSTDGMELTRKTSPFFDSWIASAQQHLKEFRQAILERDFQKLSELTETNCVRMHACAMASNPSVLYWNSKTLELMQKARELRKNGVPVFFTVDAGPNVVFFCEASAATRVRKELSQDMSIRLLSTEAGEGTRPFDAKEWL